MSDCKVYRNLKLTLVSATDVDDIRLFGQTKVYATVTIGDDHATKKHTLTDMSNRTNPRWNQNMEYPIDAAYIQNPGLDLHIELYIKRTLGDKPVGHVSRPIYKLFHRGTPGGITRLSLPLETDHGVTKGEVTLEYGFGEEVSVKTLSSMEKLVYAGILVVVLIMAIISTAVLVIAIVAIVYIIHVVRGPDIVSKVSQGGGGDILCEGIITSEEREGEGEGESETMNAKVCSCSIKSKVKTSRTSVDLGRRFRTCENDQNDCGFFEWVDPPMSPRSKTVIHVLLKKFNAYEVEVKKYKTREIIMLFLFMFLVSWLMMLKGFIKPLTLF